MDERRGAFIILSLFPTPGASSVKSARVRSQRDRFLFQAEYRECQFRESNRTTYLRRVFPEIEIGRPSAVVLGRATCLSYGIREEKEHLSSTLKDSLGTRQTTLAERLVASSEVGRTRASCGPCPETVALKVALWKYINGKREDTARFRQQRHHVDVAKVAPTVRASSMVRPNGPPAPT